MRVAPLFVAALVLASGCLAAQDAGHAPAPAVALASGHQAAPTDHLAYLDSLDLPVWPDARRVVLAVEALSTKIAPVRHGNLPTHEAARKHVEEGFHEAGLEVSRFSLAAHNAAGRGLAVPGENVLGVLPGRTGSLIILGAHYDGAESGIGAAYDNGSGVCAILELARTMARYEWDHTLVFAAWDWEETGLYGSRAYAEHLRAQGHDVALYLNFDMVGINWPAKGFGALDQPLTAAFGGEGDDETAAMYRDAAAWLGYPAAATRVVANQTGGSSDHGPFLRNGYPAATFLGMPPVVYPFYHSADTFAGMLVAAGGSREDLVAGFGTVLDSAFALALLVDARPS